MPTSHGEMSARPSKSHTRQRKADRQSPYRILRTCWRRHHTINSCTLCQQHTHQHQLVGCLGTSVVSLEDPFHFQLHQARAVSPCLPPGMRSQEFSQSAMWQWQLADEQPQEKNEQRKEKKHPATSSYEARTSNPSSTERRALRGDSTSPTASLRHS